MSVVVPEDRPDTRPAAELIVATAVLLLLQVPEPGASDKNALDPAQICDAPRIEPGCRFTVATIFVLQPVGRV